MDKINFQNLPNTTTPVNATNLNQLQTNVENAITRTITTKNEGTFPISVAASGWRTASGTDTVHLTPRKIFSNFFC